MSDLNTDVIAFLAPTERLTELLHEVEDYIEGIYGDLVVCDRAVPLPNWVQNIWYNPVWIKISSIKDASKKLRMIQRNWACYSYDMHRRAALIQDNLPHVSAKPVKFPTPAPDAPLGSWCLIEKDLILASDTCSSPFPNGEVHFIEDKTTPPTRAYLKLWEALTVIGKYPKSGETCIDLGSCPGGWSWVLHELGANVISVDKAPLAPHIAQLSRLKFRKTSAFGLDPERVGPVDWMFSDIICYPDRLLRLINNWKNAGMARNIVCTVKLQGETDFDAIKAFTDSDPDGQLIHLYHNKHELTWVWLSH